MRDGKNWDCYDSVLIKFNSLREKKMYEVFKLNSYRLLSLEPAYKESWAICFSEEDVQSIENYLKGFEHGDDGSLYSVPFFSTHKNELFLQVSAHQRHDQSLKKILQILFSIEEPLDMLDDEGQSYGCDISNFPYIK